MSTKQTLNRWQENNDSVHWVQQHRDELMAESGLDVPYRLHEIDSWLDSHKGAMTRALKEASGAYDQEAPDEEEDADPEGGEDSAAVTTTENNE